MTTLARLRLATLAGTLTLSASLVTGGQAVSDAAAARAGVDPAAIRAWTTSVWEAARDGDSSRLEQVFDRLPLAEGLTSSGDRFRSSLSAMRANRMTADSARMDQRDEAVAEMRVELEAGHQVKALRKAVAVQSLSQDLDAAFDDPEIMDLVRWSERAADEAEAARNWLDAQELLYLLRTFYEDTARTHEFEKYDERLTAVNERVGLIARYVPERLHALRNEHALALGEEPLGPFNAATAVDWQDRLDGVKHDMLVSALKKAAEEHIETDGWRPLFRGGLQAVKLMATTSALAETFPSLADPVAVGAWTRHVDGALERLADTPSQNLDHWTLKDLLDHLKIENDRSVKLPFAMVLREFGDGALNELDVYSEIIWPDKLRRFQQATAGNFVGVGILIRHNDKRDIMVVNPLEGSPAYFAGVKPNDIIMEVDGDSTVGWSLNDAVDRITGELGKAVELGLKREGEEDLVRVSVKRDRIKIRSVKGWLKEGITDSGEPVWDWWVDPSSRIAYIRLTQFTEDSVDDLLRAWEEISADAKPNGLVFDLRHNPGGLLTAAVRISNLFVPSGSIVTGEDKTGRLVWRQVAQRNLADFKDVPTVVLVNRGSASASEIVAGCLQAHHSAVILGERSFGKGSVQTIHHIGRFNDGRLKLTTQYYRLPSADGGRTQGRLVHKRPGAQVWGVDPDIEVPMSVQQIGDAITLRQSAEIIPLDDDGVVNPNDPERPDVNDLLTEGIDTQLAVALLILQAQALDTLAPEEIKHAARPEEGAGG